MRQKTNKLESLQPFTCCSWTSFANWFPNLNHIHLSQNRQPLYFKPIPFQSLFYHRLLFDFYKTEELPWELCWPRDISSSLFSLYQKEIVAFRKALLTQRFFRHRNSFCESTGWNPFFHPTLFVSFGSWTWCRCLVIKSGAMVVGATGECNKSEANPLQLMQLPSTRQSTFPRLPRMVSIKPGILDFRLQVEFQGGNKDRLSLRIWDIWENSIHFSVVGKSKHWYGLEGSKWQSK